MKLSNWAKLQGISYTTAYRWYKNNRIPNAYQRDTGTILVDEFAKTEINNKIVIYCRVSSQQKRKDLASQVERCESFCAAKGLPISKVFKEVDSGMNDKRREFMKMLDYNPTLIVVENKDRLTRFGFNYLDYLLSKQNCKILVINQDKEDEKDLMKDMISIISSFCCRLYGLHKSKTKIDKIKSLISEDKK